MSDYQYIVRAVSVDSNSLGAISFWRAEMKNTQSATDIRTRFILWGRRWKSYISFVLCAPYDTNKRYIYGSGNNRGIAPLLFEFKLVFSDNYLFVRQSSIITNVTGKDIVTKMLHSVGTFLVDFFVARFARYFTNCSRLHYCRLISQI